MVRSTPCPDAALCKGSFCLQISNQIWSRCTIFSFLKSGLCGAGTELTRPTLVMLYLMLFKCVAAAMCLQNSFYRGRKDGSLLMYYLAATVKEHWGDKVL